MFDWLKKNTAGVKADTAPDAAAIHGDSIQGGDPVSPPAISESEAFKNQGNAHFGNGNLEEAAQCFRRAIELDPRYAEAYTNLGNVFYAQGNLGEAAELYRQAVTFKPGLWQARQNLGNVLLDLGQNDAAEECFRRVADLVPENAAAMQSLGVIVAQRGDFRQAETLLRRALELQPDYAEAYGNLGSLLLNTGRLPEAEAACRRALELKPDYADAHFILGNVLRDLKQLDGAISSFRRALEIKPDFAEAYGNLGSALRAEGRLDEALACFQQQARLMPDNGEVQHHIAALTGHTTERAPVQYVERVFDGYADKFDAHLQQELKYHTPENLVELLKRHAVPPAGKWKVLDMGCGTGLVGKAIAPDARELVGVDLSPKMLEKAEARKIYQRLERQDLLAMMRGEKAASYDVVVAADVFIYLGKVDEIFSEIKRLLCPGGFFAFSLEALEARADEDAAQAAQREYQLEKSGRYSHSTGYMARLAAANGYLPQAMEATQIRIENGKPVSGFLVVWKK